MNKPVGASGYLGEPAMQKADAQHNKPDQPKSDNDRADQSAPNAERPKPNLNQTDLAAIKRVLLNGDVPVATRSDLIEMHKRIVKMFTTLNEGLGEQQAKKALEDRAALSKRMDELEDAVNRMEGALRIELEPMLRSVVVETVSEKTSQKSRFWKRGLMAVVLIAGGLVAGVSFQDELRAGAAGIVSAVETNFGKIKED